MMDNISTAARILQLPVGGAEVPVCDCGDCDGFGNLIENGRARHCEAFARKQLRARVGRSGIPLDRDDAGRLVKATLPTFQNFREDSSEGREAKRVCMEYAEQFPALGGQHSILLWGAYGTGKSHLAKAVGLRILKRSTARVFYVNAVDHSMRLKLFYSGDGPDPQRPALAARLLILDDLGAGNPSEHESEILSKLLYQRAESKLPTVVTSNLRWPEEINVAVGGAVHSRIKGFYRIMFSGVGDHRGAS